MSSWFGFSSSNTTPSSTPQKENDVDELENDPKTESAFRRRSDEGAVFTATKCPPGPGLENSCELPFGLVWSPMAIYYERLKQSDVNGNVPNKQQPMPIIRFRDGESLPPVLCIACLAYINPFVNIDYATGEWECPLCGQVNVLLEDQLQEGSQIMTALNFSCVEYRLTPQSEVNGNEKEIKESVVEEDDEDYCTYIFVVDENLDAKDGQAIVPAFEALVQEQTTSNTFSKIRIGLIVYGKSVWTYHLGLDGLASSDLYVTPEPSAEPNLDSILENDMDKRAYLVEVEPNSSFTSLKIAISSVFDVGANESSPPNGTSQGNSVVSPRIAMLAKRKEARIRQQNGADVIPNESPWVKQRRLKKESHPTRCVGEAVQSALDLASSNIRNPSRTARILLFTNGCPNNGDGSVVAAEMTAEDDNKNKKRPIHDVVDADMLRKSVQYFDMSGRIAVSNGIGFDVFCAGSSELALPAYQALVEPSGGYVLPLLSFQTSQLGRNLSFLLENTYMSRSRHIPEDMDYDDAGAECILDIRTNGFISPTQLCGSGEILPDVASRMVENERPAFAAGSALAAKRGIKVNDLPSIEALELSMTRIQVGRVDPLLTLAVMLEVDDSLSEDDDCAFFQLIARYVSSKGNEEITRVCSFQLPIAKDVSDFVSSTDDEAVSVVLGKAAVYRALHGREENSDTRDITAAGDGEMQEKLAYDTQLDLDATIQRISGAFRILGLEEKMKSLSISSDETKETAESSLKHAFPPQLQQALVRLYHLRRGILMSPGPMRSMDDRAGIRGLFLRYPLEDCLRMMEPSVWSTGSLAGITSAWDIMQPFPAETLALWDSSIVAADFHDALFVWTGANCSAARYDGIRDKFRIHLLESTKNRFPLPELHELKEGDSMSRRFTARLAPSHADPLDNQLVHFPALSTLHPTALKSLRSKFKFYDAKSDASFRAWFWGVASASNVSRLDGTSLCE